MPAPYSAQPPVGCGLSPLWLPDAVKAHSHCLFRCHYMTPTHFSQPLARLAPPSSPALPHRAIAAPARHSVQPPVGCGLSPLWLPDAVKAHSLCLFTRCPSTEAVCHPATAAISLPGDGQGPLRPARRYRLQTDRLRSTRAPDDVTIHGYSQHVNPVIGHRGLDVGGKPNRPLADLGDARPVAIVNSKQSTMWNITILRARLWSVALSP